MTIRRESFEIPVCKDTKYLITGATFDYGATYSVRVSRLVVDESLTEILSESGVGHKRLEQIRKRFADRARAERLPAAAAAAA